MGEYQDLLEKNREWVRGLRTDKPHVLEAMAAGQAPHTFFVGCCDSRVPPEEALGLLPGELFVHRNIANLIHNADLNFLACLDYACNHLKVERIVICGHTGCGGIKAAMECVDHGILNPWLRNIRDVYRMHAETLDALENEADRYDRLAEINVIEQCINIFKYATVQNMLRTNPAFSVHGWIFDVRSGLIRDLNIDFESEMRGLARIYDVTGNLTGYVR